MPNRTIAPLLAFPKAIPELPILPETILENLSCYTLEGGSEDVLKIDVVFKAGTLYDSYPLLANTTLGNIKEGTANFTGREIAETVDFFGSQIQTDISYDRAEITLVTQGKHLVSLLDVFTDVLLLPVFPEKEFAQYVKRSKSQLSVNLEKVEFNCRLLLSELMFSGHPYREQVSVSAYDALTTDMLRAFHSNHFSLNDAYVLISGRGTATAKDALAAALSAKWKAQASSLRDTSAANWQYSPSEKRSRKADALQSAIRMGAPALSRNHPDYPLLYLANMALGGYFGSRLMQNIREDKGYTYGIGSSINVLEDAAYLLISTQVGAEVTEATLHEIRFELQRMQTAAIDAAELQRIKRYILGNLVESFDGPFATADRLKLMINHRLDGGYFSRFAQRIPHITAEEITAVSAEFFNEKRFSLAVVGEW